MSQKLSPVAVGIDLGTNRYVISVIKQGGVEIVTNSGNYRQTPSMVSYGKLRTVGEGAQAQIKNQLNNTIFSPSRLLGVLSQEGLQIEKAYQFSKMSL